MARALCSKCGKEYQWPNKRGYRLREFPSSCCGVDGQAIRCMTFVETVIKYCPLCNKAGLRYHDGTGRSADSFDVGHGKRYCPRCQQWVLPIRVKKEYTGDVICSPQGIK